MMNERIVLSVEDILNKEFKIDTRGFRPQEVDKFLDTIIRDYSEYNNIVKSLETAIAESIAENNSLRDELRKLRSNIEAASSVSNGNLNNVDLLKRISQLEKVVYGKFE